MLGGNRLHLEDNLSAYKGPGASMELTCPVTKELIANKKDVDSIRRELGADRVGGVHITLRLD